MIVEDDRSGMDALINTLSELEKYALQVGIFGEDDSFMQMIAGVHEFGLTIRPKRSKYLAIPIHPKYRNTRPRGVQGLFYMKVKDHAYLVRNVGKDKLEFCFLLTKEVVIPERSFIRSTFDEQEKAWAGYFEELLGDVIDGGLSAEGLYEKLGALMVSDIQKKMKELKNPPKSRTTLASEPGKTNPLIRTGKMRQAVTWKVVKNG